MASDTVPTSIRPAQPSRALWYGPEIAKTSEWLFYLSDAAAAEIRERMEPYIGREISPDTLTEKDFSTPVLNRELAPLSREISDDGLGFAVLRGVPLDGYTGRDFEIIHWAIGKALGSVITQGGSLGYIAHVMDLGEGEPKSYYAQVGGPLPMHMDPIDVAALLCLKSAREGGTNLIVSSAAVHNRILERHPKILERLYEGYFHSCHAKETGNPEITAQRLPLFTLQNGHTYCTYLPAPIHRAAESGMAGLTAEEREALEVLDREALSEDLVIAVDALPGDSVFLNNRTVLHSRTHYEDSGKPEDRRHSLRVWMHMRAWDRMPPQAYHFALAEDRDEKIFLPDFFGAD